jgi:hypothetical protein
VRPPTLSLALPAAALAAVLLTACGTSTVVAGDPTPGPPAAPASGAPTPATSSTPLDPAAQQRQRIVVSGTGDVNLDPEYVPALRAEGYEHAWSGSTGSSARTT